MRANPSLSSEAPRPRAASICLKWSCGGRRRRGTNGWMGRGLRKVIRGSWGEEPLLFIRDVDVEDGHGVVAEDVNDFDSDFAAAGRAFVEDAGEFERAVFLGAEGLPFVFENVVAGPDFFVFGGGGGRDG